jgi:3-methyladenine DNA glycosylase AlkC
VEPFKNLLNAALVRSAAAQLQRHGADFDAERFIALATQGLDALEMKQRALHICSALEATAPADFDTAAAWFEAALAGDGGLRGWILWSVGEYVARRGQARPQRALATLHALTQNFTAEFAIRPFIVKHPALVFETLARWVHDDSAHVRRLVSEGSRPRLPWGLQLKALIADPSPTLPLLQALQDDPSDYVRRSVANHLNDIAKDHPALVAQWLTEHLPGAGPERRALLKHASRTLIKKGHAPVLQAWGVGGALRGELTLALKPKRVQLGGELQLGLTLRSTSPKPQALAIDYVVHHVKADGSLTPKVFKGWNLTLAPRAEVLLNKRHPVKPITTRRYHAGRHELSVQVNGRELARTHFHLSLPRDD